MAVDLDRIEQLSSTETGLCVVAVDRGDGGVLSTVVNAGVLPHPVAGHPVVAFVTRGGTVKHERVRAGARITVTFRRGWQYVSVEGAADVIGPDDPFDGFDAERLPQLLRDVFAAAGGTHDDWDEYDRVMAEERRVAVLVRPERTYG
ncbi:MAG: pyridoxamine 5'-phosphate oxidase [Actinobacteria bacterium]|nr:pyridoxamine 5'-phosphate oxidase [Actinomycetota bacterium]